MPHTQLYYIHNSSARGNYKVCKFGYQLENLAPIHHTSSSPALHDYTQAGSRAKSELEEEHCALTERIVVHCIQPYFEAG